MLMLAGLSPFIISAITIVIMVLAVIVLFKIVWHTFHGDIGGPFTIFIVIALLIAVVLFLIGYFL